MPNNEGDFRYYCLNLLIRSSKIDGLWMIHNGESKNKRLRIDSVHFRSVDVNDNGTVVAQTAIKKNKSNRGLSNIGTPFTTGIPCPSASLEDVKNDIRYNRQPGFNSTSRGRLSGRSSSVAKRVLMSNETSTLDDGEVIDIAENNEENEVEKDTDSHQPKKSRGLQQETNNLKIRP
jgi:hypothetical protein